MVADYDDVMFA